jgi:hypothetical protein
MLKIMNATMRWAPPSSRSNSWPITLHNYLTLTTHPFFCCLYIRCFFGATKALVNYMLKDNNNKKSFMMLKRYFSRNQSSYKYWISCFYPGFFSTTSLREIFSIFYLVSTTIQRQSKFSPLEILFFQPPKNLFTK